MNKQTCCTKSAIWQEYLVKRKDILRMSLVLLSNHEISQRNINTSIKALLIKHYSPHPFPPKTMMKSSQIVFVPE